MALMIAFKTSRHGATLLVALVVGACAAACGAPQTPPTDQTTVTVEKPGSSADPPSSAPGSPAPSK
jgi:hypothetical protein